MFNIVPVAVALIQLGSMEFSNSAPCGRCTSYWDEWFEMWLHTAQFQEGGQAKEGHGWHMELDIDECGFPDTHLGGCGIQADEDVAGFIEAAINMDLVRVKSYAPRLSQYVRIDKAEGVLRVVDCGGREVAQAVLPGTRIDRVAKVLSEASAINMNQLGTH